MLEPILIVPDTHAPYHDRRAWSLMMDVATDLKPKHIVCMGDIWDCYTISKYSKSPERTLRFREEMRIVNSLLDQLDSLGAENKLFVEGNHEDRLRIYMQDKAPELWGMVALPDLLRLAERGWLYVPYKNDIELGRLHITHDTGNAGKYAVYRAMDAYQHSVITGHSHRMAYLVEGDATGQQQISAQFGWLGDIEKIDYMHKIQARRNWALGFGIGYLDPKTDIVYLVPVPIVNYTCMVNGRLYKND